MRSTTNVLDDQSYALKLELDQYAFDAILGNELVGRDLHRAGQSGRLAISLGASDEATIEDETARPTFE